MLQYLSMMYCIASIMLIRSKDKEKLKQKDELWQWLKDTDLELYKKIKRSPLCFANFIPGPIGRGIYVIGYKIAHMVFGFN